MRCQLDLREISKNQSAPLVENTSLQKLRNKN